MRSKTKRVGTAQLAVAAIFLTMASAVTQAGDRGIKGKPAPAWSVSKWLNLPDGAEKIDVKDYEGKVLYLFCFQSWCPGCHRSGFPTMLQMMTRFKDNDDVAFVAIQTVFEGFDANTFEHAKEAAEKYELEIPVGQSGESGVKSELMTSYRTGGTPWVVIIDKKGIVRFNDYRINTRKAQALIRKFLNDPKPKDPKPTPTTAPTPAPASGS